VSKEIVLLVVQGVVVVSLAACVSAGHNSAITDALIAICGSIAGIGVYDKLKK
jgi:Na+/H+ antiporter NhaB